MCDQQCLKNPAWQIGQTAADSWAYLCQISKEVRNSTASVSFFHLFYSKLRHTNPTQKAAEQFYTNVSEAQQPLSWSIYITAIGFTMKQAGKAKLRTLNTKHAHDRVDRNHRWCWTTWKTQRLCLLLDRVTVRCWGQYLPCMAIQKLPITEQLHVIHKSVISLHVRKCPQDPTSIFPTKEISHSGSKAPALQAPKHTVWNALKKERQNSKHKKGRTRQGDTIS